MTCVNTAGLAASAGDDTFIIHVTLDPDRRGRHVVLNTATVALRPARLDPNPANDTSDTTSTTVDEDVELSVTKTFDCATVTAGGASQTFTIDRHQ